MITVLIADSHTLIRRGICAVLEHHPGLAVVGEAADGQTATRLAAELRPDVVLLDLVMHDGAGPERVREIGRSAPGARVVVLTTRYSDDLIRGAIQAGALSYLLKDVEPAELVHAIRSAARGQPVLHPSVSSCILKCFRGECGTDRLTRRERDVLVRIALGESNQEIAHGLHVGIETVKTHVSHVLAKLHLEHRTQAAIYALDQGLVPSDRSSSLG